MRALFALSCIAAVATLASCRIERAAPQQAAGTTANSTCDEATGDVWVYTSMYRHVIDAIEPKLAAALPNVKVHWFQAGSEKVQSRLDAELAAGGTQADVLLVSDPFLYERFKASGRWQRYVSPNALRTPLSLVDLDGHYTAARLSTMVLVHRSELADPPKSFFDLTQPRFAGAVALGDPLTSGTAYAWAAFMAERYGEGFFQKLRDNRARIAGGNAAVLQKLEGQEATVGVLLLENALAAKRRNSPITIVWPEDGAVVIPGDIAIFQSSRHVKAAQAVVDWLLSPEGQRLIVTLGDMHSIDPRLPGPGEERNVDALMASSQPWSQNVLERGGPLGAELKASFSAAFSR